jgi:hypothetical protein
MRFSKTYAEHGLIKMTGNIDIGPSATVYLKWKDNPRFIFND